MNTDRDPMLSGSDRGRGEGVVVSLAAVAFGCFLALGGLQRSGDGQPPVSETPTANVAATITAETRSIATALYQLSTMRTQVAARTSAAQTGTPETP